MSTSAMVVASCKLLGCRSYGMPPDRLSTARPERLRTGTKNCSPVAPSPGLIRTLSNRYKSGRKSNGLITSRTDNRSTRNVGKYVCTCGGGLHRRVGNHRHGHAARCLDPLNAVPRCARHRGTTPEVHSPPRDIQHYLEHPRLATVRKSLDAPGQGKSRIDERCHIHPLLLEQP